MRRTDAATVLKICTWCARRRGRSRWSANEYTASWPWADYAQAPASMRSTPVAAVSGTSGALSFTSFISAAAPCPRSRARCCGACSHPRCSNHDQDCDVRYHCGGQTSSRSRRIGSFGSVTDTLAERSSTTGAVMSTRSKSARRLSRLGLRVASSGDGRWK